MLNEFIGAAIKSDVGPGTGYVEYGYGQVEPNHLSAQRNGQIYAQLPADKSLTKLEQGRYVKYDYAKGLVDLTGPGEWMLVYNEIKLYRPYQQDCEFAMIADNYQARLYSLAGGTDIMHAEPGETAQSRYYNGENPEAENFNNAIKGAPGAGEKYKNGIPFDDVTAGPDIYEPTYNEDPFHLAVKYEPLRMPEGTSMVPRVFKTSVGDIYTTNTIKETTLEVGDKLTPGEDGYLAKEGADAAQAGTMVWQVVKLYTMPDGQKGAKLMRIQ